MNRRRWGAGLRTAVCPLAVVVSVACAVAPAPAQAASVSFAAVHDLAVRAANGDPAALDRLRAITAIDGRPSGLGALLSQGTAGQVRERVIVLAHSGAAAAVSSGAARATAAEILRQPRYGKATVPDPLGGLLSKLGHALGSLAALTPGGPLVLWLVAAAVVVGLSVLVARRTLGRLSVSVSRSEPDSSEHAADPAALERAAQAAEARGAFDDAIRLRFRAGLLTLGQRGAIEYRPSLLTADVAHRLHSPQFDSLARTFEQVAYGSAPARPADAAAARGGWSELLLRLDTGR